MKFASYRHCFKIISIVFFKNFDILEAVVFDNLNLCIFVVHINSSTV